MPETALVMASDKCPLNNRRMYTVTFFSNVSSYHSSETHVVTYMSPSLLQLHVMRQTINHEYCIHIHAIYCVIHIQHAQCSAASLHWALRWHLCTSRSNWYVVTSLSHNWLKVIYTLTKILHMCIMYMYACIDSLALIQHTLLYLYMLCILVMLED